MKRNESVEDYLETILMLRERNGLVRSIDIARQLDYSKPSISRAMGLLREKNYIVMDREGWITLTDEGYEMARRVYDRHQLLTTWLTALGVTPEIAAEDACRIEHDISDETFEKLKDHIGLHKR
ncbi:DtxR family transcriptional regulator [Eubacteriales bacterium]|nr:metal-dependent transcriptional regulator [Faecalicatena sp. BF-R-105]GKH50580.1 DtxR family transcriptional regulator [Eubacteriales bacterium]GKH63302.1 DtxR family transcriptional regulator [Eubacteriales bacterium]